MVRVSARTYFALTAFFFSLSPFHAAFFRVLFVSLPQFSFAFRKIFTTLWPFPEPKVMATPLLHQIGTNGGLFDCITRMGCE
jgi:hypothetical protein